ncbi:putative bifunctional diguanylate cyclase/phosphodiesterase [Azonexus fungiphilus]|uniref:putative bifunctional diguanylate cyclase/phosphodiesterase n=1 Tax=Azonexus fungiphilus TaxID=146940 RepID=UPI00156B9487|nr:EAL domain-containing protein [Azonexus fungiphilus]NHC05566.1 EAL domain-containing protein [Azonexus fungiphilus]
MIAAWWRRSLLLRTVGSIVAISALVGGLIVVAMSQAAARQAEAAAYRQLAEMLDTVESTASVACFVGDGELAMEVARGLLSSSLVAGVDIATADGELVRLKRHFDEFERPAGERVVRELHSPFAPTVAVGRISIQPDAGAIAGQVAAARNQIVLQAILMIVAVTLALTLTVWRRVIEPISVISRRLQRLDPGRGEQLVPPRGCEQDEFGSLTGNINSLSSRLLGAIEREQGLRRQHEIDERKYRGIFEQAESGIFIADAHGCMSSYNHALARLLGLPQPRFDRPLAVSLSDLAWADAAALQALIGRCLESNQAVAEDFELRRSIAPRRWLSLSLTPLGDGQLQGILIDVTERRNAELAAQRTAITDTLTGLPNRQGFEEYWSRQIVDHPEQSFALLMIDLEGFKQLNDALGFPAGDRVLIGFAARIFACVKESDWTARVGGDEFAVVLRNISNPKHLEGICRRILDNLGERFTVSGQEACLGASIGATFYPGDGTNLPTLLRNAELALNDARSQGGRRWSQFDQGMIHAVERRHNLASDLRLAIERDELRLHYQPIVDLASGRVVGAEALMRWQHPAHGLVPPDYFISLAEQSGLINDIGAWCLDSVCAQLAAWQADGLDIHVTVNVSARQIPDGLTPAHVVAAAARHGIAHQRIGLEVTEGSLLGESAATLEWLDSLRQAGFRVYLDDFGTGYSSLAYLKRFRVDTIKIDRAFVRDMGRIASDRVMIEAVVMMASGLQLKVVAEGIETAEQLAMLRAIGCHFGQGYHFSRPVPPAEFPAALARIASLGDAA